MRPAVWIALAFATGCAGKSEKTLPERGSPSGSGGTAGFAGTSGTGGAAGTSGTGGAAGTAGRCEEHVESGPFGFGVTDPQGISVSLNSVQERLFVSGTVRSVEATRFSVQGCGAAVAPHNAGGAGGEGGGAGGLGGAGGCDAERWTIDAFGPELVLPVETNMQVTVAFASWCQPFSGCNHTLTVRDELAAGESALLAMYGASFGGSTGGVFSPLEWPVTLSLIDLQCYPSDPGAPVRGPTEWALSMTGARNSNASLLLRMGQSGDLALDTTGTARWHAYNVSSFDRGGVDATTSLYFYLARMR